MNKKRRIKIIFSVILFITLFVIVIVGAVVVRNNNSNVTSSGALFGGKVENGYPYAGFLISSQSTKVNICGAVYLSDRYAVSAAHCIMKNGNVFLGESQFRVYEADLIAAQNVYVKPLWEKSDTGNDLSFIKLNRSQTNINQFADIGTPATGCDYVIVGYGKTENEAEDNLDSRPRKSADVCIDKIDSDVFYLSGKNGGICYGDSGSPIFKKDTKQVVGIISSIIPSDSDNGNYCYTKNKGVAVRLDKKVDQINAFENNSQISSEQGKSCNDLCNVDSVCADGLSCKNNRCLPTNGSSCSSTVGEYCSSSNGVSCNDTSSCVINTCVKIEDPTVTFTQPVNLNVFFSDKNFVTGAIIFIGILTVGGIGYSFMRRR